MDMATDTVVKAAESDLVRKAADGDRPAFDALYRRHHPQVYGVIAKRLDDRDLVDDLVQITFMKAFRSLPAFRGEAAFSTWLTQIALNVYRSHLRSQRVRRRWVLEAENPEDLVRYPRESPDSPYHECQKRQSRELVRQGIQTLPERYRRAVWLRYVKGRSYEEIMNALQVPMGTVKTWLCRARRQLEVEFRRMGLEAS
jgi:RNA polymerase sigma-70 factor (ECF subfamily)